jgi:hypothetical protein
MKDYRGWQWDNPTWRWLGSSVGRNTTALVSFGLTLLVYLDATLLMVFIIFVLLLEAQHVAGNLFYSHFKAWRYLDLFGRFPNVPQSLFQHGIFLERPQFELQVGLKFRMTRNIHRRANRFKCDRFFM